MTAADLRTPGARLQTQDSLTAGDLLADACARLARAGADSVWLSALVLLEAATGLDRATLLAHPEWRPAAAKQDHFSRLLDRRCARQPLAQILGYRDFFGRRFAVSPAVLIPRPETEGVVGLALDRLRRPASAAGPAVLDVGTGSGAIAVSILAERPDLMAVGTDVSPGALAIARDNARRHEVGSRLRLIACNLATSVGARFPVVVANLPYVPTAEIDALEPEVAEHEPREALDGGADGTATIRRLLADLDRLLAPGGTAFFEIGDGQAAGLTEAARDCLPEYTVRAERDPAGIERYLIVEHSAA